MQILTPPAELLPFGLRALKMIATANGVFDENERGLLDTAQAIFGSHHDLDALEPLEPTELAAKIVDPGLRRQLVRGMVAVSLIDGEASPEEADLVERFADAFEIASPDVKALQHLAHKSLLRARFDIARRFFAREKVIEYTKERGLGWLASTLVTMAGLREDTQLAGRYRALGQHPQGSLGRAYYDFIKANEFTFPGEKGSPPEVVVLHDLTHVLSGYGTDPKGELQVLAFHAGCRREGKDPFGFLMFGIAEFHLGLALSPVATGSRMQLDPAAMFAALERGSACTIDPTDGWDPWAVMDRPLDELRAEYKISPLP
jgi:tellurite resistance protein